MWLQSAKRALPQNFAGFYGSEDAVNREDHKSRNFIAKKRKGILGIVGFCIGMRYRVIDGTDR